MVVLLSGACLFIGVASYLTLEKSLEGQMQDRLNGASHRASMMHPIDDGQQAAVEELNGCAAAEKGGNPLQAPGQGSGTLNLCIKNDEVIFAGWLDGQGQLQELSDADIAELKNIQVGQQGQQLELEAGPYLVSAQLVGNDQELKLLTGVPLEEMRATLGSLLLVMTAGSGLIILLAGLLGSVLISRTMRPLERVSAVATDLARADLGVGLSGTDSRVAAADAHPGTEVGSVGYALNQLLDNVQLALETRQRTEEQMRVFVADASHELRTPLAAIKGYSQLIRWTEDLTDSGEKSLTRIDSQTQRMSKLVEDLLLLARLDEGKAPQLETVDMTEIVLEAVTDLQVAATDHTWNLQVSDEPVYVRADKSQLEKVVLNLLSNAWKHTEKGSSVWVELRNITDTRQVEFVVTDNGQGIEPEFVSKIFDRFSRADRARSGSMGTTGLGLPIVKAIVEAHGGALNLETRPGCTVFKVRLPRAETFQN